MKSSAWPCLRSSISETPLNFGMPLLSDDKLRPKEKSKPWVLSILGHFGLEDHLKIDKSLYSNIHHQFTKYSNRYFICKYYVKLHLYMKFGIGVILICLCKLSQMSWYWKRTFFYSSTIKCFTVSFFFVWQYHNKLWGHKWRKGYWFDTSKSYCIIFLVLILND